MTQLDFESAKPDRALAAFFAALDKCTQTTGITHGLHPYPAKFIPHIPRELIRAYTEADETVWDPMCGSGTTLVEAVLEGRHAIGTDINPVAVLVARAKTTPLRPAELDDARSFARLLALDALRLRDQPSIEATVPAFPNRDHWFQPQVTLELAYAKQRIDALSLGALRDLLTCAFSAIVVLVSNQESETRWRSKPRDLPPGAVLAKLAEKVASATDAVQQFTERATATATVVCRDARRSALEDESVDCIVTSPPYANSHDYYLYNKLRLFWLGHDVGPVQSAEIGSRNRHSDHGESIDTYLDAMSEVLVEAHRVLRQGRVAVVVVADAVIRGDFFSMAELIPERASAVGFDLRDRFSFDHRRFNRAFQRGFGTARSKATHVLVLRRT